MPNTPPRNGHDGDWPNVYAHAEIAREAKNWTKARLYEEAGISEPVYNGMREGRPLVRPDKLGSFRAALDWSRQQLDALLAGEPIAPPSPRASGFTQLQTQIASAAEDRARLHDQVADLATQVIALQGALQSLLELHEARAEAVERLAHQVAELTRRLGGGAQESSGDDAP